MCENCGPLNRTVSFHTSFTLQADAPTYLCSCFKRQQAKILEQSMSSGKGGKGGGGGGGKGGGGGGHGQSHQGGGGRGTPMTQSAASRVQSSEAQSHGGGGKWRKAMGSRSTHRHIHHLRYGIPSQSQAAALLRAPRRPPRTTRRAAVGAEARAGAVVARSESHRSKSH